MGTIALPRPHRHLLNLAYEWQALIVVIVATFMVMLDTTVVNIALPRIITVFNAPVGSAQFVLTGYMIALAVIMPATGYLSDTYGTKRVYLVSMFLFTIGSLLCGLAWDVPSLVFFRVLQGLGGGMLLPLGTTVIFKVVPPHKRGTVMGIFGLPIILAPVIGPTLGGYLVEYVSWRVIFTLNIPVGALALLLGWKLLRETERVADLHLDLLGFILSGLGFAAALYGLERGPQLGWGDPETLLYLAGGGLLLAIWVVVELSQAQPLLELRVFRNLTYTLAMSINFVMTLGMFSSMLLLPLFLQNFRGLGAMETGLLLFPQAVATGVMMPISGRLFDLFGPRPLIVSGLLLLGYSTWQLGALDLNTPDTSLRIILVVRGAAMGLAMMPAMTVAMNTLPPHLVARGSSLTNVLRQLFAAFGTATFVTLLQSRQQFHQAMLAQAATPDTPGVRATLAAAQRYLLEHGASLVQAKTAAILALYREVGLRAAVLSFQDCFMVAAAICLVGVIPALFMHSSGLTRGRPGRMMAER